MPRSHTNKRQSKAESPVGVSKQPQAFSDGASSGWGWGSNKKDLLRKILSRLHEPLAEFTKRLSNRQTSKSCSYFGHEFSISREFLLTEGLKSPRTLERRPRSAGLRVPLLSRASAWVLRAHAQRKTLRKGLGRGAPRRCQWTVQCWWLCREVRCFVLSRLYHPHFLVVVQSPSRPDSFATLWMFSPSLEFTQVHV